MIREGRVGVKRLALLAAGLALVGVSVARAAELPGVVRRAGGVSLVENHGTSYLVWHAAGVRGATVVHVDTHDDCRYVPQEKLAELGRLAGAKRWDEIFARTDHAAFDRFRVRREDLLYTLGNYLYPCLADGTAAAVYWVVPERRLSPEAKGRLQGHLRGVLRLDRLPGLRDRGEDGFGFDLLGGRFEVTTLPGLPRLPPGALLDLDTDFFAYPFAMADAHLPGDLLWDPREALALLRERVPAPAGAVVAYSTWGGYLPMDLRFLGDALFEALAGKGFPDDARELLARVGEVRAGRTAGELGGVRAAGGPWAAAAAALEALDAFRRGDDAGARTALSRAAALDPGYRKGFLDLGGYAARSGRIEEALTWVAAYEEHEGGETVASAWLRGLCRLLGGDLPGAGRTAERLLGWSRDESTLNLAGRVAMASGDLGRAERLFREAWDARPNAESAYRLGWVALRRGARDEAVTWWLRVSQMAPHYEQVDYNLGLAYLESGEVGAARLHLEQAVAAAPDDPDAWNALGIALARMGRLEGAGDAWKRALALAPGHAGARANLERLGAIRRRDP